MQQVTPTLGFCMLLRSYVTAYENLDTCSGRTIDDITEEVTLELAMSN